MNIKLFIFDVLIDSHKFFGYILTRYFHQYITIDLKKMVLDQGLRRVTNFNIQACWPSFTWEIFYASSDGATCYTRDCISINAMYFGNKKWGGQKILCPPLPP